MDNYTSPQTDHVPSCAAVGGLDFARKALADAHLELAWEAVLGALRVRPFHPDAYLLLAQVALAAGARDAARLCAEHAREMAPKWQQVHQFLSARLCGGNQPEWLTPPETISKCAARTGRILSVCLIVQNEEEFLGNCLDSLRGLAEQLIVIDTGSTDQTIEIAKNRGAEVHNFLWSDDFSAARNAALAKATGDWVLMIDADEELSSESHAPLQAMLATKSVMAWRLPLVDVGREDEGCCYVPRLFRNAPGLFYVGRIHEQVFPSLEASRRAWGLDNSLGKAVLRHHGYRADVCQARGKTARNLRLLKQAVVESPRDANLRMNYGLELVRSEQLERGLPEYRTAFDLLSAALNSEAAPELREMLLSQFTTQLLKTRQFNEVTQVLTSPLAQAGGLTASLHFSLGLACIELNRFQDGADQMRACVAMRGIPALAPINGEIHKAGPRHCLAICFERLDNPEAALEQLRMAIEEDPESYSARFDYARLLAVNGQRERALHLLFALAHERPQDIHAWVLGGRVALSRFEFLEVAVEWTAEAIFQAPNDPTLRRQRAEALTLSEQCSQALPLWRQLEADHDPARTAALIICETILGENAFLPSPADEALVSQEFVRWYQRLLQFHAYHVVELLNARLNSLKSTLPSAFRWLNQALAETREGRTEGSKIQAPENLHEPSSNRRSGNVSRSPLELAARAPGIRV
jgi:tetratricopeptide (TPR) repeat protein